jgi:hypothetical protein
VRKLYGILDERNDINYNLMPNDILLNLTIFFLPSKEFSKQASNIEWDLQLYYSTVSVLWEEQKRLAKFNKTQFEPQWVLY